MPSISDIITGTLTGLGNTFSSIVKDFKADPTKVVELDGKLQELNEKLEEAKINLTKDLEAEYTKQIQTVNATMQSEAKSEHWIVYSWRPTIGFTFSALVLNNFILYPYLHQYGVVMLDIPVYVWVTLSAILGVTAVGRTLEKIQALK